MVPSNSHVCILEILSGVMTCTLVNPHEAHKDHADEQLFRLSAHKQTNLLPILSFENKFPPPSGFKPGAGIEPSVTGKVNPTTVSWITLEPSRPEILFGCLRKILGLLLMFSAAYVKVFSLSLSLYSD